MSYQIQPAPTPMQPWVDGQAIDREIAEKYPCDDCGAKMRYRAEFEPNEEVSAERESGRRNYTYRAFAVCTNSECGNEHEF